MKKRTKTKAAVLLLCAALLMFISGCAGQHTLRLGTGGTGGRYYAYGGAYAQNVQDTAGLPIEVLETTGSEGNLRLLQNNLLDMAIVQGDTLKSALDGRGAFAGAPLTNVSAIGSLYTEACQIVAGKNSGIKTVADLAGKRVSIGEEESGVSRNAEQILLVNGLKISDIQVSRLSFADSAAALLKGEIDAFFCTGGVPTPAVAELADETPIQLISLDSGAIDRLLGLFDGYVKYTVPAGTYDGQDADITTVGVQAILVANNALDSEIVKSLTAAVFANQSAIAAALGGDYTDLQNAAYAVPIGFHPGAASYYAGQGLTVGVFSIEKAGEPSFQVSFDMYQTLAMAVVALFLGGFLKKKFKFLQTFCIPSPVVGGLLFAIAACVLYSCGVLEMQFDETLRNVCMVIFFTSVGFQANMKVLKSGGIGLLIFLVLVTALIIFQNFAALGMARLLGVDPAIGLSTGSIPMVGGHGTAGAFGPVLEDLGLEGATSLATASATFGLIVGSLMGGPVGRRLIVKHDLLKTAVDGNPEVLADDEQKHRRSIRGYAPAAYQIALAMGIGTVVSWLLSLTGMNFPIYIGAMIVAAVMRNTGEYSGKFKIHIGEINDLGGICLSLFLGIAMITLKLWQLAGLALPLIALLLIQVVLMFFYAYFVVFRFMGKDYDAAVLAAGTCGFGMGATPNAMANMQAITEQFVPSIKAYILVPIVGSMFADFINSIVITFFINSL